MSQPERQFESTIEQLLFNIEAFLDANPHISEESFGWFSIRQPELLKRLRDGGDVSTRNLDRLIAYMRNPVTSLKKEASNGKKPTEETNAQKA